VWSHPSFRSNIGDNSTDSRQPKRHARHGPSQHDRLWDEDLAKSMRPPDRLPLAFQPDDGLIDRLKKDCNVRAALSKTILSTIAIWFYATLLDRCVARYQREVSDGASATGTRYDCRSPCRRASAGPRQSQSWGGGFVCGEGGGGGGERGRIGLFWRSGIDTDGQEIHILLFLEKLVAGQGFFLFFRPRVMIDWRFAVRGEMNFTGPQSFFDQRNRKGKEGLALDGNLWTLVQK